MLTLILQPYSRVNTENPYPILDLFPDLLMLTGLRKVVVLPVVPIFNFTITVQIPARADWLLAIVYKSTDNKNDVRCSARAFSSERKANSARNLSLLLSKTNRRQFSMVYTLIDNKMTP